MLDINDEGALETGQCLDELIRKINSELTGGCMIPIKLPKKESIRIIETAKDWFYKHYEDSVQENYYVIDKGVYGSESYKKTKTFELPGPRADGSGRIFSVNNLSVAGEQMIGLSGKSGFVDADFSMERLLVGGAYGVPYSTANGDSLMYYVITEKYFDLARQILISKVSFNYNRLNRKLKIMGKDPKNHIILEVYETIADCALYSDEIFYRYCLAYHKKVLGTMIMTFGYSLPGRITLNGDMIRGDAQEELQAIKEEIKGDEGTDYFMTS